MWLLLVLLISHCIFSLHVVVDGSLTNACCFAFYVSPFLPSLTVHVVLAGYFASLHPLLCICLFRWWSIWILSLFTFAKHGVFVIDQCWSSLVWLSLRIAQNSAWESNGRPNKSHAWRQDDFKDNSNVTTNVGFVVALMWVQQHHLCLGAFTVDNSAYLH